MTHQESEKSKSGPVRLIAALVVLALAVWFILVNTSTATIRLWVSDVEMPMWIMLAVVFAAGWAVGALLRMRSARRARKVS